MKLIKQLKDNEYNEFLILQGLPDKTILRGNKHSHKTYNLITNEQINNTRRLLRM